MIETGMDALRAAQIDALATDAVYRRGADERSVKAVLGRTVFRSQNDYGAWVRTESRDFIVTAEQLDIKAGELGALAVVGVYEIATGGAAVAVGDVVSVDPATGKVVAAGASGAVKFGHAVTAATATDATVNVRLAQGLV